MHYAQQTSVLLVCTGIGIFVLVVLSQRGLHLYRSGSSIVTQTLGKTSTPHHRDSGSSIAPHHLDHHAVHAKPPEPDRECMLPEPLLPSFIFMGYGHSGSTTTADVLNDHPNISYGEMKEHNFLCFQRNSARYHKSRFRVGIEGYKKQFYVPCGTTISFDMTPQYFAMVLKRSHPWFKKFLGKSTCQDIIGPKQTTLETYMKHMRPDLKFLFIVRNPVDYLRSIYGLNRTFENFYYMQQYGCYAEVIEAWQKAYPTHEIKIFSSEDLFDDPVSYFADVFGWLGVANHPPSYYQRKYEASGRRRAAGKDLDISAKYVEFLQTPLMIDCKARLEKFAGRTFRWTGAAN